MTNAQIATSGVGHLLYKIEGRITPLLTVTLRQHEALLGSSDNVVWTESGIATSDPAAHRILPAIAALLLGPSRHAILQYQSTVGTARVAFAGHAPGRIVAIALQPGQELILNPRNFIACAAEVSLSHYAPRRGFIESLSAGANLSLVKLSGQGDVFIASEGDLNEVALQPQQSIRLLANALVACEGTVALEVGHGGVLGAIARAKKPAPPHLTLTGPGRVLVQTLPVERLLGVLLSVMPKPRGD